MNRVHSTKQLSNKTNRIPYIKGKKGRIDLHNS
uniref:Uncharacterized protein n=1 Tax=Arundo donax TaxID=35708 RepID=A0A0A9AS35_ARUDO